MPAALLQFAPAIDDTLSTSITSLPSSTSSTALSSAIQQLPLATVYQWLTTHDPVGRAIVEDMARSLLLTKVSGRPPALQARLPAERKPVMSDPTRPTMLTEIVRRQTANTLVGVFSQTVQTVAQDLALDLMREPEFREQIRAMVRAAFTTALRELNQPAADE